MATYAIGDVQGCFRELALLLDKINYSANTDQLWFAGDLINRGPDSLRTIRFIKSLSPTPIITLGNHDLHLLALLANKTKPKPKDTLDDILNTSDKIELLEWLRHQKLFHFDKKLNYALVHAGLAPQWSIEKAQQLAKELENVLQSDTYTEFLNHLYGNEPNCWNDKLKGYERLRLICNYFTRIRFCDDHGAMNMEHKGNIGSQPPHLYPWFSVPNRVNKNTPILFGHWSALRGKVDYPNVYPLDGGCVWGEYLIAKRLEDGQLFKIKADGGLDWRRH